MITREPPKDLEVGKQADGSIVYFAFATRPADGRLGQILVTRRPGRRDDSALDRRRPQLEPRPPYAQWRVSICRPCDPPNGNRREMHAFLDGQRQDCGEVINNAPRAVLSARASAKSSTYKCSS
jgi:hypothetical protein